MLMIYSSCNLFCVIRHAARCSRSGLFCLAVMSCLIQYFQHPTPVFIRQTCSPAAFYSGTGIALAHVPLPPVGSVPGPAICLLHFPAKPRAAFLFFTHSASPAQFNYPCFTAVFMNNFQLCTGAFGYQPILHIQPLFAQKNFLPPRRPFPIFHILTSQIDDWKNYFIHIFTYGVLGLLFFL